MTEQTPDRDRDEAYTCPACGWSTRHRYHEAHICPDPAPDDTDPVFGLTDAETDVLAPADTAPPTAAQDALDALAGWACASRDATGADINAAMTTIEDALRAAPAPDDTTDLRAEVERLRDRVAFLDQEAEAWRDRSGEHFDAAIDARAERDAARADLAALRGKGFSAKWTAARTPRSTHRSSARSTSAHYLDGQP